MTGPAAMRSGAAVRATLRHPVVDADGHWQEPVPMFLDHLRDEAGPAAVDGLRELTGSYYARWYDATPVQRRELRIPRAPWWPEPPGTLDRATSLLPALLAERLDELGIDVALVYPTLGLFGMHIADDELRRSFGRAANRVAREAFAPYADRLLPVALVAHRTPAEAIEALEDAVALGFRAIFITGAVARTSATGEPYIDFLGLDSPHDHEPFWRRCVELGVAVTAHGGSFGWPDRSAPSNSVFNHIGHFANASHGFAKALVLGGVPGRHPRLRFAFLEGGVSWAAQLHADLVGHWEKRNGAVLRGQRPCDLDVDELGRLFARYGGAMAPRFDEVLASPSSTRPFTSLAELTDEPDLDEFAASFRDEAELAEWFDRFSFGCEADDRLVAWAFDPRAAVRLRAMFGSDIGHFDVPEMAAVLGEAHELVERGLLTEADFADFTFGDVVRLHTATNPEFFAGTVVADAVAALLAPEGGRARG
jgi:predicted TIM-barrel fold metal-dependent hydrolase